MGTSANGLWPIGTYWHLETRPDELQAMQDGPLKSAAQQIDDVLNQAKYQTLVHGDAKVANFCFANEPAAEFAVAAVDFQYVGRGVGVKDVAYFISSCLSDSEAERMEESLLNFYFHRLGSALNSQNSDCDPVQVECEWRKLYPFAWADFCRFLQGWSPGHWKLNGYSSRLTKQVMAALNG